MSASGIDQVLTQRHQARQAIVDVDEAMVKLVVFELGPHWFAIRGEQIAEVLGRTRVFFVPGCPPSLEGVINVRGEIETVIQINALLHVPVTPNLPEAPILLGVGANTKSGIRVDRMIDVLDVLESSILAPPSTQPEHFKGLVTGVTQFLERPVSLLDIDRVFADYAGGQG